MFPPGMTETRSPPYTMRGRAASARASGLLVAVLTLVALALRATQLNQSLFGDELFTYDLVHGHGLLGHVGRAAPCQSPVHEDEGRGRQQNQ